MEKNLTSIHEDVGSIPALLSGLRIQCCRELWCKSQMRLGFGVAMAVARAVSCSSDSTPGLGASPCYTCGPRGKKKKRFSFQKYCCLVDIESWQVWVKSRGLNSNIKKDIFHLIDNWETKIVIDSDISCYKCWVQESKPETKVRGMNWGTNYVWIYEYVWNKIFILISVFLRNFIGV